MSWCDLDWLELVCLGVTWIGLNNSDAIEKIEAELPASKERDEVVLFVKNSQRGIIKGYTSTSDR